MQTSQETMIQILLTLIPRSELNRQQTGTNLSC